MKNTQKTLVFTTLLTSVFFLTAIMAFADDVSTSPSMEGKMHKMEMSTEMKAKHEAMNAAIEANDFAAFQKATAGTKMAENLTAEKFEKIKEAHAAMKAGDMEKVKAMHAEMGVKMGEKMGGMEMSAEMKAQHEAVQKAVEANDFAAFTLAVKGTPMAVVDTAEKFAKVVEAHTAMKAGDKTKMEALHAELGFPTHEKMMEKMGEKMEMRGEMKELKEEKKEMKGELKETNGEIKELRKEMKQKFPKVKANAEIRKTVKAAVEAGNFEAFKASLPEGAEILNHITAENFAKLKELDAAKTAKDRTKVKALETELGLSKSAKRDMKKLVK